ncbi:MAG TPA: PAS domain S-box protein [Dehalococcoidia bacterium]|nr:PAS domain S-box protein [Dehalococcoidia bacterium]
MTPQDTAIELALLVEQAPDGVIFADREGVVRFWNAAAARIFGHAPSSAVGQTLDMIIPESLREAHWTGYDRALAAGETKYRGQSLPTKAARADGATIYVELSFEIVKDRSGAVIGALAHARDITERFERDRQMRRRLRELEAAAGDGSPS